MAPRMASGRGRAELLPGLQVAQCAVQHLILAGAHELWVQIVRDATRRTDVQQAARQPRVDQRATKPESTMPARSK
jgi:hypothetical protein